VAAWGDSRWGGNNTFASGLSGVNTIYSTWWAFAALKTDGTVAAWGEYIGNNVGSGVPTELTDGSKTVTSISSTQRSFAALKSDGTVVEWGYNVSLWSGATNIPTELTDGSKTVTAIYSTLRAFAALKSDGTVAVWGDTNFGGSGTGVPLELTNGSKTVTAIYSTDSAFAALKSDDYVTVWGDVNKGGSPSDDPTGNNIYTGMPSGLSGVKTIYSNTRAFSALKDDGTVAVWGQSDSGGDASSVQAQLTNVTNISYSNPAYQGRYTASTVIDPSLPSPPVINTISTPNTNTTPTVTGTGITGHTITLFAGSNSIGTATVANGVWSITSSTLANATYAITATATNPIGVVSSASTSQSIEIAASAVPSISPITTSNFSWRSVLNGTEDDTDGTVTVNTINVENGNPVTITINGTSISNTTTVTGNVAQVPILASELQSLTDGQSYTMTANVSNSAGIAATTVTM
jgi:hypothetical protein